MPDARARWAADPTQRRHRFVHTTARVKLPLAQLRLAPGNDERGLTVLGGIVHLSPDRPRTQHLTDNLHRDASRQSSAQAMTVKTDKNDARGVAQFMRLGWFRPAHVKMLVAQEIRACGSSTASASSPPAG
jgi:hypothetical protein